MDKRIDCKFIQIRRSQVLLEESLFAQRAMIGQQGIALSTLADQAQVGLGIE